MDINKFLSKLFGNKSTRDMKLIQPLVETVKKAYPEIQALSNDALRAKTQEVKKYVQSSADDLKAKIAELKAKVEEMPIEDRSSLFSQIDKLEKDVLERYEQALNEVMPVVFSIVKSTAERFATQEIVDVTANDFDRELAAKFDFVDIEGDTAHYHNHWTAGGNDTVWNMIHYDVQLFGGVVLHQGKIAEMATGEALLVLPEEYFAGLGSSKDGTLEFSDEFKFTQDQRVFKIKLYGNGKAYDNSVAILLDISELEAAYVMIKAADVNVTTQAASS